MILIENLEKVLTLAVEFGIVVLEFIGVCILLWSAIKSLWCMLKKDEHMPLMLAQGIALSLEFKLGGEVLRTVIVREWSEILILGAVIILRGLLTFLIHWEIKNEEAHVTSQQEKLVQ